MRNEQISKLLQEEVFLKTSAGKYVIYDRKWLLEHLEEEFELLKWVRDSVELQPFDIKDLDNYLKKHEEESKNEH